MVYVAHTWHFLHLSTRMGVGVMTPPHLTSALMTTSTKWDFSPLQLFPADPFTHPTPTFFSPEERLQACLVTKKKWWKWHKVNCVCASKEHEYIYKKKKIGRRLEMCFFFLEIIFLKCVFFACHSIVRGGMRDNSNSTAKFKIQFMNSSPAFRLSWASFPAKQSH